MCIVTISRGSYSGAKAIAEGVANCLDVPCVSREVIAEAADLAGISADSFAEVLEQPPSFFARVSRERDAYMTCVRAALYERAAAGSFVYHGHGGHYVLSGLPNLLRLRVIAPLEFRVDAVRGALGLNERRARHYIAKMDRYRAKWVRFLYGVDWTDPRLYDLVVNLERVDVESAIETVARLARAPRFARTEELRHRVANQSLAYTVTAALTKIPEAHNAGLEIEAEDGIVVLRGTTQYDDLRRSIVELVEDVRGVAEVRCEITLRSDTLRS